MTEIRRTYSLVDVAERLGRARTTLADWARQFRDFLPTVGSGRTMRYTEEALEVFGLISKMKDANEPPEYIRQQLRGLVTEIIVPMTEDDDGKPYLMQLAEELDVIKRRMVIMKERLETLMTDNDGLRRELDEARREVASANELLTEKIVDVSSNHLGEIRISQEQMTRANDETRKQFSSGMEQRIDRLNSELIKHRIKRQLEHEALEQWTAKPEVEKMKKAGWFRKEEDTAARDRFVRDYIDDHYEAYLKASYGLNEEQ